MMQLTLVTGNKHKLAEWQRIVPADIQLDTIDIDLDEIQSMDVEKIVADKVKRAYAAAGKPVVVEDVSAGLDNLGGLPGPFMKFFEKQLGKDALFQLAKHEGDPVTVRCGMAYYDGQSLIVVASKVPGRVAPASGENGFGFDYCFIPDGQNKTYAQMTAAEKDSVSHRGKALAQLLEKLQP